jgi:steroid 5-alpha reductase family enzyme
MITEPTRTCNTRQSLLDPVLVYDNCNVLESYAIQVDRKYSDHEATIVYPIVCLLAVVWSVFLPLYRLSSCRYIVCLLVVVLSVFLPLSTTRRQTIQQQEDRRYNGKKTDDTTARRQTI